MQPVSIIDQSWAGNISIPGKGRSIRTNGNRLEVFCRREMGSETGRVADNLSLFTEPWLLTSILRRITGGVIETPARRMLPVCAEWMRNPESQ